VGERDVETGVRLLLHELAGTDGRLDHEQRASRHRLRRSGGRRARSVAHS
jgi:hypothetical protein